MADILAPSDRLLAEYRNHVEARDLDPCTVQQYCIRISHFLDYLDSGSALTLNCLTFKDIQDFIISYSHGNRVHARRIMHISLRDFFSFAYRRGVMNVDLTAAVPGIRLYRLSNVPRPIAEESAIAILDSIDRNTEAGCRDFAMITLLHIYGPRAVQLRRLKLDGIDWSSDTITFPAAKNGKQISAPLLPEAGNAVLEYIRRFRTRSDIHRELFLTATTPPRPLGRYTVRTAVRWRIDRAGTALGRGVKRGTHCFRYACATRMLKAHSSLKTVADALGHRKLDSVQFYNKLDVEALREIALPWPGGAL
jgi:integrase/recombinase XerD